MLFRASVPVRENLMPDARRNNGGLGAGASRQGLSSPLGKAPQAVFLQNPFMHFRDTQRT